jgi:hypothetical protein
MPAGRPTDYTQETADIICERLADGESLRTICDDADMPARSTVFRWLSLHKEFSDQYARAKEVQAEVLADELISIADDGRNDWMERKDADGENIGWRENGEALRRSALRIDTRKWVAAKLLPKKYGEKIAVGGSKDMDPIETKDTNASDRDLAKAIALVLSRGINDAG